MTKYEQSCYKRLRDQFDYENTHGDGLFGLATTQLGIMDAPAAIVFGTLMIDPKITFKSKETKVRDEGCWSLEDRYDVERSVRIAYEYTNDRGNRLKRKAKDLKARVIQHEVDHLTDVSESSPLGITIDKIGVLTQ